MKVKYTIKYQRKQKPKQVIGYVHTPKDLPEGFTSEQFVNWACDKHNLHDSHPLDIKLHRYINPNFKYGNAKGKPSAVGTKKDTGTRK